MGSGAVSTGRAGRARKVRTACNTVNVCDSRRVFVIKIRTPPPTSTAAMTCGALHWVGAGCDFVKHVCYRADAPQLCTLTLYTTEKGIGDYVSAAMKHGSTSISKSGRLGGKRGSGEGGGGVRARLAGAGAVPEGKEGCIGGFEVLRHRKRQSAKKGEDGQTRLRVADGAVRIPDGRLHSTWPRASCGPGPTSRQSRPEY